MAIYSYNILVESKQIDVIKRQFTSITDDKGLLVLLLVWGFGGLLEGMAGFGTAVAIPAAILIGLGFKPMFSALVPHSRCAHAHVRQAHGGPQGRPKPALGDVAPFCVCAVFLRAR